MCGFAGILNHDGAPLDPAVLKRMSARIVHRGPDDEGHVLLPGRWSGAGAEPAPLEFREPDELRSTDLARHPYPLGFAFRRLSIIDVSQAGHQPMCNEDGSVWIVFNGEFYGSEAFVPGLEARGHRFRSKTDTEVIVHLYEEHGIEGTLERMDGMFAFALCDLARGRLFLARDRVGVKPLYFAEWEHTLAFGSEVKSLFEVPGAPRALDSRRLPELLQNRYLNAPNTIFAGVQKLEPGAYRAYDVARPGSETRRYWSIFDRISERAGGTQAAYHEGLIAATQRRLRSDVPLGVFLSGGLDSSTLCGVVRRDLGLPLQTFSVEFADDSGLSEAWASREVSRHLDTEHHGVGFGADPLDSLPRIAWHTEEPIADPALLPTYSLAEFTRRFVTVALSGEGSDETNYGYAPYTLGRVGALLRRMPPALERPALASIATASRHPRLLALSRFLRSPASEHDQEAFLSSRELRSLLRPDVAVADAQRGDWWKRDFRARSVFDARPLIHFHTWLADDLLLKVDKMSMAHSLEVRVPYLDPSLLETVFAIGARAKLERGRTKALLRNIAAGYVPDRIRERAQHGFLVPLERSFEADLFGAGGGRLRSYLEPATKLIDPDAAVRCLAPGGRLDRRGATALWLLAMTGLAVSNFDLSVR